MMSKLRTVVIPIVLVIAWVAAMVGGALHNHVFDQQPDTVMVGVLPISNGGPGVARKYPNCKADEFVSVKGECRRDELSPLRFSSECCRPDNCVREVTAFVPDLPKRLFFRDPSLDTLIISDETASPALLTYTPTGDVHINRDDGLKCLYYDGHPVAFLVYKNGSRVRVPCVEVP